MHGPLSVKDEITFPKCTALSYCSKVACGLLSIVKPKFCFTFWSLMVTVCTSGL